MIKTIRLEDLEEEPQEILIIGRFRGVEKTLLFQRVVSPHSREDEFIGDTPTLFPPPKITRPEWLPKEWEAFALPADLGLVSVFGMDPISSNENPVFGFFLRGEDSILRVFQGGFWDSSVWQESCNDENGNYIPEGYRAHTAGKSRDEEEAVRVLDLIRKKS